MASPSSPTGGGTGRSTPAPRRRAVRIVAISDGQATGEDLVLDRAEAGARLGDATAALIFDDTRPGALDLTYESAAARYGAPAAALIFPSDAVEAGSRQQAAPPT